MVRNACPARCEGGAMIPAGTISADSLVVEPANCFVDFIDPAYREDAPRIV